MARDFKILDDLAPVRSRSETSIERTNKFLDGLDH
jgi:hypothetical protein